jgi:hypothetical protein
VLGDIAKLRIYEMLTPEMRYRQAIRKARIIAHRELLDFLAGKRDWLECSTDRERAFVIAEIGRAYEAGRASALSSPNRA